MARKRLQVELSQIQRNLVSDDVVYVGPKSDDNIFNWEASIKGPIQTPYQGGNFVIEIKFPTDYPFKPPKVLFKTKVFHPNISKDGHICVDILDQAWSPALTIHTVLLSITSLLGSPNPTDPLSLEAAKLYNADKMQFDEKARTLTKLHAMDRNY